MPVALEVQGEKWEERENMGWERTHGRIGWDLRDHETMKMHVGLVLIGRPERSHCDVENGHSSRNYETGRGAEGVNASRVMVQNLREA